MTSIERLKQQAALAAIPFVKPRTVIGVGTGSTVQYFITALAEMKAKIDGAVASSEQTAAQLTAAGIPLVDLNSVSQLDIYVDGADEFNPYLSLIKGGGGALTREKIIAAAAKQFVCIVDSSKRVNVLGQFPLPIEVIPCARSYVAREMVKLGGDPEYRQGFVTDNGNVILDVHHLEINEPRALEQRLNNIPGVVTNGLFALRGADKVLMATEHGVETFGE